MPEPTQSSFPTSISDHASSNSLKTLSSAFYCNQIHQLLYELTTSRVRDITNPMIQECPAQRKSESSSVVLAPIQVRPYTVHSTIKFNSVIVTKADSGLRSKLKFHGNIFTISFRFNNILSFSLEYLTPQIFSCLQKQQNCILQFAEKLISSIPLSELQPMQLTSPAAVSNCDTQGTPSPPPPQP